MIEGLPERMEAAQLETHDRISGRKYERVPYGAEIDDWGANESPCHDCGVIKGQLHVIGCDVERCPCCDGQAIFCECDHDIDDADDEPSAV
jgi:hypothetical protein